MNRYHLAIILALAAGSLKGTAQETKLSIGVQLNPIVNLNSFAATDRGGKMKPVNIGTQTGLEINYRVNDRFVISPIFKYYRKSQRLMQGNFFGYLNAGSYTYKKYTYENIDPGLLLKYKLTKSRSSNLYVVAGVSYSFADQNEYEEGYHFMGDNPQSVHLGEVSTMYTPDGFNAKVSMWHPLIGIRNTSKIGRLGIFEYGLVFYMPTKEMPKYQYDQVLVTDDKGAIPLRVNYTSTQYTIETSIIYHLFHLSKQMKVIHPKRDKAANQPHEAQQ